MATHDRQKKVAEDVEVLIDQVMMGKDLGDQHVFEALKRLQEYPEVLSKRKEKATEKELAAIHQITKKLFHR